jgi:hypothetical protein
MKPPLIVIGVLICVAFVASIWVFARERNAPSFVRVLGAGFLLVVVFTHVFEAVHLFPWMGWGLPHSVGHYVDLVSATCGLIFVAGGYLFRRLTKRRTSN